MDVPIWLGYLMLIACSISLVGVGVMLIAYAGGVILNILWPNLWINHKRFKIKRMSKEQFDAYILALRYEWTKHHVNRGQKEHDQPKED